MDDQEQQGDSILEPIGRAAVDAVKGVGAEIGAIFGGGEEEGPGAAIGRAAADILDSPRDPASDAGDGPDWTPIESGGGSGSIIDDIGRTVQDAAGGIFGSSDNDPWGGSGGGMPVDDTPPTGTFSDPMPDGELPPDAETLIS